MGNYITRELGKPKYIGQLLIALIAAIPSYLSYIHFRGERAEISLLAKVNMFLTVDKDRLNIIYTLSVHNANAKVSGVIVGVNAQIDIDSTANNQPIPELGCINEVNIKHTLLPFEGFEVPPSSSIEKPIILRQGDSLFASHDGSPRNLKPGRYRLTLTVQIADNPKTFELKYAFTIKESDLAEISKISEKHSYGSAHRFAQIPLKYLGN